jgi:V8-like Glu-specific endopeptidase
VRKRRHFLRSGALFAVAIALALVPGPSAWASDSRHGNVVAPSTSQTQASAVVKYWTRERMAKARPLTPRPAGPPTRGAEPPEAGKPVEIPGYAPTGATSEQSAPEPLHAGGVPRPYTNLPDRTIGKVFFTRALGGNFVCSGTALNSENKSVVWTAGHCVHDGRGGGGFHRNWVFVPAYASSCCNPISRPYGTWTARTLNTRSEWAVNSNFRQDLGAAVLNLRNGQKLANVVGGQGLRLNSARQQFYSAFGYPAEPPFNGLSQQRCNSNFLASDFPPGVGPATMMIHCNMTGGSSGGGWLTSIAASGLGFVTSVNSYGYSNLKDRMFGPYQGSEASSLYNQVRIQ